MHLKVIFAHYMKTMYTRHINNENCRNGMVRINHVQTKFKTNILHAKLQLTLYVHIAQLTERAPHCNTGRPIAIFAYRHPACIRSHVSNGHM